MLTYLDHWVQGDGVRLATRDYGGEGKPILLIHGAGRSLADWLPMVAGLKRRHHLVAMDLRGHGLSEPGPWNVAALLGDIEAVLDRFGMECPNIVGHSMGGILGHLYAEQHPETAAVVNLDGFCLVPERLTELPADVVRIDQDREWGEFFSSRAELLAEAIAGEIDELLKDHRLPIDIASELVMRCLTRGDDKTHRLTVAGSTGDGMQSFLLRPSFDLFKSVAAARCRTLILRANAPSVAGMPDWQRRLTLSRSQAIEAGLRELAGLEQVTVSRIDASHGLIVEMPDRVAGVVTDFLEIGVT